MDWRKTLSNVNNTLSHTYDSGLESLLDRLGYEHKRSTADIVVPALGIFSAGLVVGAALGLLFAPKGGAEIRSDLRHRLDDLRQRGQDRYDDLRTRRAIDSQES
jgi:hypothetical protein